MLLGWVANARADVTSAEATLATALSRTLDAKSNIVLTGLPNALAEAQKIIRELDRSDARQDAGDLGDLFSDE